MRPWTQCEIELLAKLWVNTTISECTRILNRPTSSIYYRVRKHGFKRSAEYMETAASGRFHSESTPWNKGLKGWQAGGNSKKTQFKRGHGNSNNAHPVGTELVDNYGTLIRKVQAKGARNEKWVPVKNLIYEEHHGEIPRDHMVIFRDDNKDNHSPCNLMTITRADLMRRNTIHRYGKEYTSLAFKVGQLNRLIRQIEENEEH